MADPRHRIGREAERRVAAWLSGHGWRILAERHRSTMGELDLVALDAAHVLVAVEVRLRRSARSGSALESVSPRKVRRLRTALAGYAAVNRVDHRGLRVDLVSVSPGPEARTWRLSRLSGIDGW